MQKYKCVFPLVDMAWKICLRRNIASESVVGVQFPTLAIGAKLHNKIPDAEGERQKEKDMKRNTSNKATSNKEEKSYISIPLYDIKDIKSEVVSKTCTRYQLGEGVSMDICEGEEYDYGSLNLYGVVIMLSFREITKGERKGDIFVSYPQYKNKAGEYKPFVTNYSKALNASMKAVIKAHYDGDGFLSVEGEELPFN